MLRDSHNFDADPDPAFYFDADADADLDTDLTFHSDPTYQLYADQDPPTTHFFPDLDLPMLQNDPLRLSPFHFDVDPDLKPTFR